ncbi:hypothetical protein PF002_g26774 [Phytophthora fragariae]|uniref:Reverse transcriptase domain-containing protein n=2 Tax=Phytophthora fragariae TaxID=53985 RepID=A0A6A3WDN7_9STRA|nr:hypothetical protein PF002_g26774 [Phytophthora fragariae]
MDGESTDAKASVESTCVKTDGESKSAEVNMELGTVYVSAEMTENVRPDVTSEYAEASVIAQCGSTAAADGAEMEEKPSIPDGVRRQTEKMGGGRTAAARRRKRRAEGAVAAAHGVLAAEVRERREERAKVLRVVVRQVIAELREQADLKQRRCDHREAQIAAAVVRKAGAARNQPVKPKVTEVPAAKQQKTVQTEEEWLAAVQRLAENVSVELPEEGKLAEMRAVRRGAMKEAKRFRAARRTHRLRQQGGRVTRVGVAASEVANCLKAGESKRKRRIATSSKAATATWSYGSCAQFSVAGVGLRKYGWCLTRDAPVDIVEGFGGGTSRVLGVWRFTGTTQYQQRITIDALLVEGQGDELLIGEDWMVERQVKMDFGSRELKYLDVTGQKVILPFTCHGVSTLQQAGQERRAVVRLAKTVKLATYTRSVVQMKVDAEDGTTGVFLPKPTSKRHLLIAPTIDTVKDGKVSVVVLNVEGRREKLPAREALGTWIPTDADMQILSLNGELERDRVAKWVDALKKDVARPLQDEDKLDIGDMEAADKDLVIALLRQYAGIVVKKPGCPLLAKVNVEHHINTGNTAPIMQRRRRHAVSENLLVDKEVDDMLSNQVIEPGEGAWGFPVVIVRKKDGSVRFCIDYRSLNAVTVKDVYPLPRVDETLEALHGSQRFTSLDLHSGYWQLGVAKEDRAKTAFTTRHGLFQFLRMHFGLCNAPSTLQRLMDCVLRGLTWICCLVYLDDVVIITKGTVAQHVVELAVVLERLAEAGLSLKASKFSFATTKMEYLGHDLTPDGIQPTDRLIKAIVDFPRPEDDVQVRRFVVLAGYYRRFVPDFGAKMSPLTSLLRKGTEWSWSAPQEGDFTWAKAWLSQKPVLIYPDYRLPFKVTTDASKTGLVAVLSQDQGHGDQPVAYASKVNSPTLSNYSISELECLAVVWAVRLFRPHLYGRRFSIVTDHIALKWLMTGREPAGRLHRWSLTLQEYDFDIQYRLGKENHVADALSRGPVPVTGERADDGDRPADDPVIGLQDVQSVTEEKVAAVNMQYAAEPMHGSKPEAQSDEIDVDVDGECDPSCRST